MFADRLQLQRFELKFHVRPAVAPALREFVRCHLELDEYGAGRPDGAYPVHSLYLDSPDRRLARATVNGDRNRFKLRLRFYDDAPDAPVHCEIKRRRNDCIQKQRAAVRRDRVAELLAGWWADAGQLVAPAPRQLAALLAFSRHVEELRAAPCARVSYRREAWIHRGDNSVRVTFDRDVVCEPCAALRLDARLAAPVRVFDDAVILEVKFTERFPRWIGEMVQAFGLVRASAAKYVEGVERAAERGNDPGALARAWAAG